MSKQLKVFITYSHKNTKAKDTLIRCLALLKRDGIIDIWHDNEILSGDKWRDAISRSLTDSDLLFYLVSAASLASERCNKEFVAVLEKDIRAIPIILERCDWLDQQLSNFMVLPDKGIPITEWVPESKGWQNVIDGVRKVVDEMRSTTNPVSSSPEKDLHAESAFQRGNVLLMLGQLDMAIKVYSKSIELKPRVANYYNNRGIAYRKKGEAELAIEDCNKAIQLKLNFADAYINRGIAYRIKGDYNSAIADYTKAIELKPDNADAYYNRSKAWLHLGEQQKAESDMKFASDKGINNRTALDETLRNYDRAWKTLGNI